jgi:hypothetical protein
MGVACSSNDRDEKFVQNFVWKKYHSEDIRVDGKIILK